MPAIKKGKSLEHKKRNPYSAATQKRIADQEAQEQELSSLLFGHISSDTAEAAFDEEKKTNQAGQNDADAPVWVDEDDEEVSADLVGVNRLKKLRKAQAETRISGAEYNMRLRARFEYTNGSVATQWAQQVSHDSDDDEEDRKYGDDSDDDEVHVSLEGILQDTTSLIGHDADLPPNIIDVKRCTDANDKAPSQATIQAVKFHSSGEVVMTASMDKMLRFFRVDGKTNPKLSGIHLNNFPIYSASFIGNSGRVVASSRRPHYYIYDSVSGKLDMIRKILGKDEKSLEKSVASPDGKFIAFGANDGYIIVVDAHSNLRIADLKLNGSIRSLTFTPDSAHIVASGSDGDVYRFDTRKWACVERFSNADGSTIWSVAASSRFLAVGADSGVVNLYDDVLPSSSVYQPSKQPIKSIMNMQTSANVLNFNGDGQILAMCSRKTKDMLKLVHVPSRTVFSNWPTSRTPLGYAWSMDFSADNQYLAIGNTKGKCLLYNLKHYSNN
mmetsp:Transcript_11405/g.17143  ORF Transcript_11405/g.17143 Transcript_11405/m.17143 type:complete len:498 (+) Transcript_11405:88-1581(+)|eukprot:CAMPEP_0196813774 /NCGR_PEP_ID=MMETSP1362-20130617/39092_1 /TAXON_ID=163516 /ORGANISM="Leptocylindrus danicus, Strain CCMP1856" /LENGTH=497 /DNA_ID=CAMNT_0042190147 /DNA_START=8 /DNA_END=1501 /DNA_ORIENTATION=-